MTQVEDLIVIDDFVVRTARVGGDVVAAQIAGLDRSSARARSLTPPAHPFSNVWQWATGAFTAGVRDGGVLVAMRLEDCALLGTVTLASVGVEGGRSHCEGREFVTVVRASERVDKAGAIALSRGVHAVVVDAVRLSDVAQQIRSELEIVDTRCGVAGSLPVTVNTSRVNDEIIVASRRSVVH